MEEMTTQGASARERAEAAQKLRADEEAGAEATRASETGGQAARATAVVDAVVDDSHVIDERWSPVEGGRPLAMGEWCDVYVVPRPAAAAAADAGSAVGQYNRARFLYAFCYERETQTKVMVALLDVPRGGRRTIPAIEHVARRATSSASSRFASFGMFQMVGAGAVRFAAAAARLAMLRRRAFPMMGAVAPVLLWVSLRCGESRSLAGIALGAPFLLCRHFCRRACGL